MGRIVGLVAEVVCYTCAPLGTPPRAPAPLSSRGLGRRPLTAETGVRIPVAVLLKTLLLAGFSRHSGKSAVEAHHRPWVAVPDARGELEVVSALPSITQLAAEWVDPPASPQGLFGKVRSAWVAWLTLARA